MMKTFRNLFHVKAKVIAFYEVEITWLNTDLTNYPLRTK